MTGKVGDGLERFGGIMSLQKNSEKHTAYCQNKIMTMKIKRLTEPVMGKTKKNKNKISGKESLSDKQLTQQLPSNAKINLN